MLSDRSFYSTVAYQGSRLSRRDRARLEELQRGATVPPDQVILLDLPPSWLGRRIGGRRGSRGPLERARTLQGVARAYRALARREGWTVLDARAPRQRLLREALVAISAPSDRRGQGGKRLRAGRRPSPAR